MCTIVRITIIQYQSTDQIIQFLLTFILSGFPKLFHKNDLSISKRNCAKFLKTLNIITFFRKKIIVELKLYLK